MLSELKYTIVEYPLPHLNYPIIIRYVICRNSLYSLFIYDYIIVSLIIFMNDSLGFKMLTIK